MSAVIIALLLIAFLASSLWIGLALMATGAVSLAILKDLPVHKLLAFDLWTTLNAAELAPLPLFILMGEILFRTRLSRSLFEGLSPFMHGIPGGLLHTNILGCTLFAAVSGSSAATTATVGRMTLTELASRGYDRDLAMGSLCGAGTLGFLIPPSIILIIYGVLAEVSIVDLFIAGMIPGLILAFSYMAYVGIRSLSEHSREDHPPGIGRGRAFAKLLPILALIALVLGSMYAGIASPTEAATIGVAGGLIVALVDGSLTPGSLTEAFAGAVKTTSMIGLVLSGALFLSKGFAFLGIPQATAAAIAGLNLSPMALIVLLIAFYAVLGMLLDGFSAIVMTLPVVLPLVTGAGFDVLWFGIFLVVVVEMAQITPPVGFNLFVVQSITGESMGRIARASLPFFVIMILFALFIAALPGVVTWLPGVIR